MVAAVSGDRGWGAGGGLKSLGLDLRGEEGVPRIANICILLPDSLGVGQALPSDLVRGSARAGSSDERKRPARVPEVWRPRREIAGSLGRGWGCLFPAGGAL